MTPENLEGVGEELFGSQWQTDLAKVLGVNRRTIRRWLAGDYPMPDKVDQEIAKLCEEKQQIMKVWVKFLRGR